MVTVSATAKVGDTFTQDKYKFTVLTENGDSGTVSVAKANEDIRGELNIPEVEDIDRIFAEKNHQKAGKTLDGCGLYLVKVIYK